MGKVKDWLMEMEEDAVWMSLDEFLDKHGRANQEVYETVNGEGFGESLTSKQMDYLFDYGLE